MLSKGKFRFKFMYVWMVAQRMIMKYVSIFALLVVLCSCVPEDLDRQYTIVYKYDGSVQCDSANIAVEEMAQELINAGIDVICSAKGNDGLIYPTVCGASTGNINFYKIHQVNFDEAEALGFISASKLNNNNDC